MAKRKNNDSSDEDAFESEVEQKRETQKAKRTPKDASSAADKKAHSAKKPRMSKTAPAESDSEEKPASKAASKAKKPAAAAKKGASASSEEHFVDLGKMRRATVSMFKGTPLIDLREFYADKESGELKPGRKGISLSVEQWDALKENADEIDGLLKKIK